MYLPFKHRLETKCIVLRQYNGHIIHADKFDPNYSCIFENTERYDRLVPSHRTRDKYGNVII